MTKYEPLLPVIVIAGLGIGAWYCLNTDQSVGSRKSGGPQYDLRELADLVLRANKLDDELKATKRFHETLEAALDKVKAGELSLQASTATIHTAARRDCPRWLQAVRRKEKGDSDEERIARNLLCHLKESAIHNPPGWPARHLQEVHHELESLYGPERHEAGGSIHLGFAKGPEPRPEAKSSSPQSADCRRQRDAADRAEGKPR